MNSKQLRLFPHANPLLLRFGASFFRNAPPFPGVYTMRGDDDRILYIGQSKNLRARLATYKNARPGEAPRKIIRLIYAVRDLAWELCATPDEAIALETALIRKHRPKFNVANTVPVTWFYLGLNSSRHQRVLRLSTTPAPEPGETLWGAYRGRALGRSILRSLARLLWACEHQPQSPHDLPWTLSRHRTRWECAAPQLRSHAANFAIGDGDLIRFLDGTSDTLTEIIRERLGLEPSESPPVLDQILLRDLERLEEFFPHGPQYLRAFHETHGSRTLPILPMELDPDAEPEPEGWFRDRTSPPAGQREFFTEISR